VPIGHCRQQTAALWQKGSVGWPFREKAWIAHRRRDAMPSLLPDS